jgi:predicted  nucleic acid-binding Zn-ribbon protein
MTESNIGIYEKILKRIYLTTINESIENLLEELDDTKKDIKIFTETIQNIEDISAKYCDEYNDEKDYLEYSLVLENLNKKKNVMQEELKNIEEKYNKALEDKEIIDFLKRIIYCRKN